MERMTRKKLPQTWRMGLPAERHAAPQEWVAADVPGAVQLDWARAHQYAPYIYADNYLNYRWMEDVYWTYRASPEYSALEAGQRLFFVCGGVAYRFQAGLGERV